MQNYWPWITTAMFTTRPMRSAARPSISMSRSALCEFNRCPSRWRAGFRGKDSDATDYGSLIDCLALSRSRFDSKCAVKPDTYIDVKSGEVKKWNGNATVCKDWLAEIGNKEPVSAEDFNLALVAVKRLSADEAIAEYMKVSTRQVYCAAVWQDPVGVSIPLKILIDLVPHMGHEEYGKTLGDFKTARNAGNRAWARQVNDYGYHVQAALYMDVYNAATGENRNDWRFVIQENVHPYQTAKRYLAREFIIEGRREYQSALSFYAACVQSQQIGRITTTPRTCTSTAGPARGAGSVRWIKNSDAPISTRASNGQQRGRTVPMINLRQSSKSGKTPEFRFSEPDKTWKMQGSTPRLTHPNY